MNMNAPAAAVPQSSLEAAVQAQAQAQASNASVPLLALPIELRQKIYALCVVSSTTLLITSSSSSGEASQTTPPLLRTCRKTRAEASQIFYTRNTFVLHVRNYDPALCVAFLKLQRTYHLPSFQANHQRKESRRRRTANITVHLSHLSTSTPSWPNLLSWLRLIHHKRCLEPSDFGNAASEDGHHPVERMVLQGMFSIVKEFGQRLEWEQVLLLLEMHHSILVTLDRRWA